MERNVSIVCVDKRRYREIAQENWGLTKRQMKGMHVHHRIAQSDGGTNDPSNLYVCSPSFHRWGWHDGDEFVEWANLGGQKAHEKRDECGKSVLGVRNSINLHSEKDENGKSIAAMKCHREKTGTGKSLHAVEAAKRLHSEKTEDGKSVNSIKGGLKGGASNAANQTGFCSPGWLNSQKSLEVKRKNGLSSGAKVAAERLGFCSPEWLNSPECLEMRRENGVRTVKALNTEKWRCTVTGKISTAGPLTRYQKKRGIDVSLRVKVESDAQEVSR